MKKRILSAFLACVLAFSLFVPVGAVCSQVEHVHSDACYQVPAEPVLICDKAEAHVHDAACYQDNLICGIPEGHVHGTDCYESVLICSSPEHTHIDSCYEPVLSCDMNEHSHDVNCYDADGSLICELPEHMHSDVCYDSVLTCSEVEHTHDESCHGESTLICSLLPEHLHTDACYEQQFVCGFLTAHTHDDTCYDENGVLICEEPEISEHVHTDDCYDFDVFELSSVPVCGLEEHVHTDACGVSESEPVYCGMESHTHESSCYDADGFLICDKAEHIHADTCYINPALLTDGKTVEINGQVYEVADFVSLTDYLLQAVIISDGVTYDLMAGDKFTGINIYKDIDVELQIRFQTNSAGEELNQLYFWKMDGICLDEPAVGELVNEEGVVYGNYFIDTDGTIYAVLNEFGLTQSIIDWRLDFYAMWQKTEGGTVIIDLGNGNQVEIELDMTRASVSKTGDWRTTENDLFYGDYVLHWTSKIEAFDNIEISAIYDVMGIARYEDMTMEYLNSQGLSSLSDILTYQNFSLTYVTEQGEVVTYEIPKEELGFYFYENDPLQPGFSYEPNELISVPSGTELELSYDVVVSSDFILYTFLYDIDVYRFDNDVAFVVDDEWMTSSAFLQYEDQRLIEKSNEGVNDDGEMQWVLSMGYVTPFPVAGMMVQDMLQTDVAFNPNSFYYWPSVDGMGYTLPLEVVTCVSQEEFDAITAAPDGLDVSPIYLYGKSFKWFLPELPESYKGVTNGYTLRYTTTTNDVVLNSPEQANYASIGVREDWPFDYGYEDDRLFTLEKSHDGLHIDEASGRYYTNWTIDVTVYPNKDIERFYFEDYMPHEGDLYDSVLTSFDLWEDELVVTNAEELEPYGISVSITSMDGQDVTDELFGEFEMVASSRYPELYMMELREPGWQEGEPAISGKDYGYTVSITYSGLLAGDADTFLEHENQATFYYTNNYANETAYATISFPHIDNSELFSKKIIDSELSEDGSTLTLTYDVRYNIGDIVTGLGYVFEDQLADIEFAKYRQGSLKVHWLDYPMSENPNMYSYHIEDSPFYGETDLLKVDEDVIYRVDIDGVDYYYPYRMATLQSESDAGWSCYVPYFKRTSGFSFYDEDGERRFYSPQFIYQVDVDLAAMEAASVYSLDVENTASVFLNDGSLDAVATSVYEYRGGILQKYMLQTPDSDNQYVARYELQIDATQPRIRDFERIDVIDEMAASMNLLADSIIVEVSDDNLQFTPLDTSLYRLLYDGEAHRLTCSIDNTERRNYYRVTYDVQVTGIAGSVVNMSNRAYITGFSEESSEVVNVITISESGGSAEGAVAKLTVKKYNADNLSIVLPGAEFRLDRVYNLSASDLEALSGDLSQDEILSYLDSIDAWTFTAEGTTDENGEIHWVNNENGVLLPLDTLFRLTEISAPDGYFISEEPRYFYLSADNGGSAERHNLYIKAFDFLNYESTLFVENQKGNFELLKTDGDTGAFLEGAQFGLFTSPDCSADSLFMSSLDYGNGRYYFGDIGFNSVYYLKETKAPDNYILSDVVYTVTVSSIGTVSISPELPVQDGAYVIANKSADLPRLPDTGSSIGLFNHWSGWTALFSGVCLAVLNWPRKKRTD